MVFSNLRASNKITIPLFITLFLNIALVSAVTIYQYGPENSANVTVDCFDSDGNLQTCEVTQPDGTYGSGCPASCNVVPPSSSASCWCIWSVDSSVPTGDYDVCGRAIDTQGGTTDECLGTITVAECGAIGVCPENSFCNIDTGTCYIAAPNIFVDGTVSLQAGKQALITLNTENTLPVSTSIDLNIHSITTVGDPNNPARYWIWFENQKDDDRFNWNSGEMNGNSATTKNIVINGFKIGTYTFKVTASYPQYPEADSTTVEIQVQVAEFGEGGFFAKAPGLNNYAFILIILLASLILYKRKIL